MPRNQWDALSGKLSACAVQRGSGSVKKKHYKTGKGIQNRSANIKHNIPAQNISNKRMPAVNSVSTFPGDAKRNGHKLCPARFPSFPCCLLAD